MLYKCEARTDIFIILSLCYVARRFKKGNRQNRIETAIVSNDSQFRHKYTRYELHFNIYKLIIMTY